MANTKITALTTFSGQPASGDWVPIVDVSDTTMAATGTTKKYAATNFVSFESGTVYLQTASFVTRGNLVVGNNTIDFNTTPDATAATTLRFFRSTNTSGLKGIEVYKGDNSSTMVHRIGVNQTTVFNNASEDLDFNIKGDNDTYAFYLDASTDRLGIGTATPSYKLHVNGSFQCTQAGETWASVTFNTGWSNIGGVHCLAQYKKVGDLIFLRGLVQRTSGSDPLIFTLPSGYRPILTHIFSVVSYNGSSYVTSRIDVANSGQVSIDTGGTTFLSLSGIVFSTL